MLLKQFCVPFQWGYLRHAMLEWQRCFRDEFDFLSRFLRPTEEFASSYPGRDDEWDKGYDVRTEPDGKIIGFVEGYSHRRIELTKADILIYKFDLKQFRQEMCGAFNLKPQTGEIDRWDRVIPWGTWEPEKGVSFPVTLFLGDYWRRSFREKVMAQALQREAAGEIILTPGRDDWKGDIVELTRKNKILLVSLDEIIQTEDGKLLPTPEWEKYLTAFYKMIERNLPSALTKILEIPPFEFRRKGQMWVVRYNGVETFLKDGVGPQHISVLLSHPHKSIYAVDLQILASKQDLATTPRPNSGDEMADSATIRDVEKKAMALLSELDIARSEGNSILESEIEEEIDNLKDYLCQVKGMGGESRKSVNPSDSIRRSVQQLIKKTVDTISENLPDCAKHFSRSIRTGFVVNYSPESEIQWIL